MSVVSGRWAVEGQEPISRTTIYRHVQAHPEYRKYLRGPDGIERKRRSQYQRIRGRKRVEERPAEDTHARLIGDFASATGMQLAHVEAIGLVTGLPPTLRTQVALGSLVVGVTVMLVSVWSTVTLIVLVVLWRPLLINCCVCTACSGVNW